MAQLTRNYMTTALLTVAAACLSTFVSHRQPQVSFNAPLDSLPIRVGEWKGTEVPLDAGARGALSADDILYRTYRNSETGRQIGLLIVYRKYGRRGFAHRPELCYPAAGWEIIRKTYTDLPYAGRDVRTRLVVAEKGGYRDAITYWFASGDRTEANYVRQQVVMALDRLQPQKYGWAFIRLNTPDDRGALDQTRDFMRDLDRSLTQMLSGRVSF